MPNGRVCLGGNGDTGAESNYIVMAGPPVDMTCHPSSVLEINSLVSKTRNQDTPYHAAILHPKQTYYVDRDYTLTSVPSFFVGLKSIMTGKSSSPHSHNPHLIIIILT